ncbi:MAG: transketolase family protein [Geminicoccaceae bacterium]
MNTQAQSNAVGSQGWIADNGLSAVMTARLGQLDAARGDNTVYSLEADLGDFGGQDFMSEFPERYVDVGIAEASLFGIATGLALRGKIPCVNTFASFALMRACEQVRLGLCYHNTNAKIFGTFGGLQSSFSGSTHHAIEDLAIARTLPNMTVVAPADAIAAYKAAIAAVHTPGPVFIRLAVADSPLVYDENCPFEIGRGNVLREGNDLTLVACGLTIVAETVKAATLLADRGIEARVIDLHTVKPVDRDLLMQAAKETGLIVTVEEHSTIGGLGGAVAEALADSHPTPMKILGVPDTYCKHMGSHEDHLRRYGLLADGIADAAESALGNASNRKEP